MLNVLKQSLCVGCAAYQPGPCAGVASLVRDFCLIQARMSGELTFPQCCTTWEKCQKGLVGLTAADASCNPAA